MGFHIAIDGPCGSGKSTLAKSVAADLGFLYIDSGAMYRAVGLYAYRQGIRPDDGESVTRLLDEIDIDFSQSKIFLNGEDVTDKIRTQPAADASSKVAAFQEVREKLVGIQRRLAQNNNAVMDGRDIGTCVLPNAGLKIYLDAKVSVRAERRCFELEQRGISSDYNKVLKEVEERDYYDLNRKHSPLRCADDAVVLDTSDMSADEVKAAVLSMANKKILEHL